MVTGPSGAQEPVDSAGVSAGVSAGAELPLSLLLPQAVRLRARVSARRGAKILFILNLPYIFWGLQKADLYYVTYVFYEERGVKKKLHRNFTNIMSIFITQPFLTAKNRAKNSNMHKNTVRRSIV